MAVSLRSATGQPIDVSDTNAVTDRVRRRQDEYLAAKPHICAERAVLATESWKETEGEPLVIRRAKLFQNILEGLSVSIRSGELIVGSQTKYIRGASPCVDFKSDLPHELLLEGKATMSGEIVEADITPEEQESLLKAGDYWAGKTAFDAMRRLAREHFGSQIDDYRESMLSYGFDVRPTGARLIDYGKAIHVGLKGVIDQASEEAEKLTFRQNPKDDFEKYLFLQAVRISCQAVITFARRYAALARQLAETVDDPARKSELERIAAICERVPEEPATSFWEALQSFWFVHLCHNLEAALHSETPGRMDQYLYPLYEKDIVEGKIDRQQAAELLGCLFVKFNEMESAKDRLTQQHSMSSHFQDVTIGGVTRDGCDATNELSFMLLHVLGQVKMPQPAIYIRCHDTIDEELLIKAIETNRSMGAGNPAFINDKPVIANFVGQGVSLEDAREWAANGCIGTFVPTATIGGRTMGHIVLPKVLELVLNNGVDPRTRKKLGLETGDPMTFTSFDQLYEAFKKQVDYLLPRLVAAAHLQWQVRDHYYCLPFNSALLDDCIKNGRESLRGGVRYPQLVTSIIDRGHVDVADSLAAIKMLIYEKKKITMAELLGALAVNFEGKEDLRQQLLAAPKYGNDDDYVDNVMSDLWTWTARRIKQEKNPFGYPMRPVRVGGSSHYLFGKSVGALPNGRKAWTPLADASLSPSVGADRKGPTAVINSASKCPHEGVADSSVLNMKLTPAIVDNREGIKKVLSLVHTLFDCGGFHVQFNMLNRQTLLEAKMHPEQYRDLLVRVAGYSAYFVELSPQVQDEIIARTEHSL